jgi:hypothetical protein
LLDELRAHYRRLARKPAVWLFPGGRWHTADYPISDKVVWHACRESAQRVGVNKPMHPHTLRNASAYYTTFQSLFFLKTIGFGQGQSAAVYGHGGLLAPPPGRLAVAGPCDR